MEILHQGTSSPLCHWAQNPPQQYRSFWEKQKLIFMGGGFLLTQCSITRWAGLLLPREGGKMETKGVLSVKKYTQTYFFLLFVLPEADKLYDVIYQYLPFFYRFCTSVPLLCFCFLFRHFSSHLTPSPVPLALPSSLSLPPLPYPGKRQGIQGQGGNAKGGTGRGHTYCMPRDIKIRVNPAKTCDGVCHARLSPRDRRPSWWFFQFHNTCSNFYYA